MSLTLRPRTHLGDADLVRYMDHQLDREGLRRAKLHLAVCSECATRLDEFQGHARLVSGALGDMPVELPDPGKRAVALAALERARVRRSATGPLRGSLTLRIAAVLLIGFTAVLATRPGRAWVASGIERLAGEDPGPLAARILELLRGGPPALADVPPPPQDSVTAVDIAVPVADEAEPAATRPAGPPPVRFAPQGRDVLIEFDSMQNVGSAVIEIVGTSDASARILTDRQGSATLVPTDQGLRVRNRPGSGADYMITVPNSFRFIRVKVADRPEIPIRITRVGFTWTINLQYSALE